MKKRIVFPFLLLLTISTAALLWFLPSGIGEYRDSPDGRYTARADRMTRGTIHGRIRYFDLQVTKTTGERIRHLQRNIREGEIPPDFSDRSKRFIEWTEGARSVTFTLGNGQLIAIPVDRE